MEMRTGLRKAEERIDALVFITTNKIQLKPRKNSKTIRSCLLSRS
ncbi:MAG: hypothetical protein RLZZ219_113 [Cyanobacteriota bacterium]|jgi:hypothetical protein